MELSLARRQRCPECCPLIFDKVAKDLILGGGPFAHFYTDAEVSDILPDPVPGPWSPDQGAQDVSDIRPGKEKLSMMALSNVAHELGPHDCIADHAG